MKNIFYLLICFLCLTGCSGCSKSGRKDLSAKFGSTQRKAIQTQNNRNLPPSLNQTSTSNSESSLAGMYNNLKPAVFLIKVSYSDGGGAQGSGFFISSQGIGVSNYHVFKGSTRGKAYIKTIDSIKYKVGQVLEFNENLDYIVFKVVADKVYFPFVKIADSQPSVGDDVFAIGNPEGLEHTLSKGIVSSYRDNDLFIQTTAEITHGSSGGALFNMRGQAIGITTSGMGVANLNFALNLQKLGINKFR